MGAWYVQDYDTAKAYLSGGHKKWDRPLYVRGLRVQSRGKGIAIVDKWAGFDPILFNPDGTLTIQAPNAVPTAWGGSWRPLRSQSVRRNIKEFSGLTNVFQRQGVIYITEADASTTPAKIQKCRGCRGSGLIDSWCSPDMCRNSFPCNAHPEWQPGPLDTRYWHSIPCEHGQSDSHNLPKSRSCYSCRGNGTRDYGSKLVSIAWDGSPLRLKDGKIIKQPPTELEKRIAAYVRIDS